MSDADKAHAVYSPSGMARILACPGSVKATSHMPNHDSEPAMQGTAFHALIETCMQHGLDPEVYKGSSIKVEGKAYGAPLVVVLEIDDRVIRDARMVTNYVGALREGGDELRLEHRVDLSDIDPECFGTLDVSHLSGNKDVLTIVDAKYGYIDVDVNGNAQIFSYSVGELIALAKRGIFPTWVRMVVVQPRSVTPGPRVKQVMIPAQAVMQFADMLRAGIALAKTENPPLAKGAHCLYCPGLGLCAATSAMMSDIGILLQLDIENASNDALARLFASKKLVERVFKQGEALLLRRMLSGQGANDLALKTSVKHRQWRSEVEAKAAILATLGPMALDAPTPAQIEAMGPVGKDIASRLATTPPGDPVVALASDKRQPYSARAAAEIFGAPVV